MEFKGPRIGSNAELFLESQATISLGHRFDKSSRSSFVKHSTSYFEDSLSKVEIRSKLSRPVKRDGL